ncbi:nucleolar complex-associated protein 3 [Impatiens glandulifera]|uniref:nucleolar complex-associated protein 3 n=1 Tax=Impatiens glandulifera TaxID=253017 RepID=UPI001FB13209|nr:nucleolar complex-associated protein 3 [Impatiens glandulifera]
MGKKQKIILPPDLPPDVADDEIEVSDEDLQFVNDNVDYAGFVSNLDTNLITKHVTRVADVKEDALEALYEKRSKKKSLEKKKEDNEIEVDRVDALPIKTLDGQLHFRTAPKTAKKPGTVGSDQIDGDSSDDGVEASLVKLTKPEKRAKLKKGRKEAKKQEKDAVKSEVQPTPQEQVLAEVEKELTAEESNKAMKFRLAELGTELLMDPESNIKSLKEMLQICNKGDHSITVIGLKSLLAVFKDIIPGYRIRLPTAKEQEMVVSKAIKKMRLYESTLLSVYKAYLNKLIALEKQQPLKRVAVRCLCTLLDAHPHFNYWESLLAAVLKNLNSTDEVVRKLCCATVKSLFTNEGKHGGEATVHAVRYIAEDVKASDCDLRPDSIEVFMSLTFDEDIGRAKITEEKKTKGKRNKMKRGTEEPSQVPANERKKNRKEQISKMRDEVKADLKAASFSQDEEEKKQIQSQTLSAVFGTYFRILTHTMQSIAARNVDTSNESTSQWGTFPLLAPCLDGIGKFAHHIDLDFMGDLITYLRKLAEGGGSSSDISGSIQSTKRLSIAERLRCCIVAFKVMRNNLDALNVDLQDFFVQLYSILLEYRAGRDQGEVLVEALKIMLCDDRQHDMQRAAAFIKRLSTFSLCFDSAEAMSALVTVKHLLQKNVKCRNLLENDAGGGSVSGPVAMYRPQVSDPNLSGALSTVLWELNLLRKHYNPMVSTLASTISTMSTATQNQVLLSYITPQQAYTQSSIEQETFDLKEDFGKNRKRKRGSESVVSDVDQDVKMGEADEDDVLRKKFCDHFVMVHDMSESKRLKDELSRTTLALDLFEKYKNQTKKKQSATTTKVVKKLKVVNKKKKMKLT